MVPWEFWGGGLTKGRGRVRVWRSFVETKKRSYREVFGPLCGSFSSRAFVHPHLSKTHETHGTRKRLVLRHILLSLNNIKTETEGDVYMKIRSTINRRHIHGRRINFRGFQHWRTPSPLLRVNQTNFSTYTSYIFGYCKDYHKPRPILFPLSPDGATITYLPTCTPTLVRATLKTFFLLLPPLCVCFAVHLLLHEG